MPTRVIDCLEYSAQLWEKPREFAKNVAPTGIGPIDNIIGGVRLTSGGVWAIQGYEGSRKTTFILNVLDSQFRSGQLPDNYWINYDTLESGMTIERISETLVCILATKILIRWHYMGYSDDLAQLFSAQLPPMASRELVEAVGVETEAGFKRETILRPEVLRTGGWTERQRKAINMARSVIGGYRLFVSGMSENPDPDLARSMSTRTWDLQESLDRWYRMSEEWGMRQLVIDNVPQYEFPNTDSPYEKIIRVTEAVLKWLRRYDGTAWVINQVPISQRSSNSTTLPSQFGGARLLEECQAGWHLHYDPRNFSPFYFKMSIKKNRLGHHQDIEVGIEPNSGAITGEVRTAR